MNWKLHTNMVKFKLNYGLLILRKLNNILPIYIVMLILVFIAILFIVLYLLYSHWNCTPMEE